MTFFARFGPIRALRWVFAATVLAAIAGAPVTADAAQMARMARPGAYDGVWNVLFATQAGNCSSTNSVPFTVTGRRVSSAGGGKVTGGISHLVHSKDRHWQAYMIDFPSVFARAGLRRQRRDAISG
jgi:hypothetical protein